MTWIWPALGYIIVIGAMGVTAKLALRTVHWPELILWAAIVYDAIALILILTGATRLHGGVDGGMAALSGACAAVGLVLFYLAVRSAEVSRVVPIMSTYPVVTVALSVAILSDNITAARAIGVALVVGGVAFLSASG